MIRNLLLIGIILSLMKFTSATVNASVDHSILSLGQSFTLTINGSSDTPDLEVLKQDFDMYGTSSSNQVSIINGHVTSQATTSVNLIPKHLGKQVIPAIKVGNEMTNPITIEVREDTTSPNGTQAQKSMYMEATLASKNSYVNVPVLYSIKLYYSIPVSNLSLASVNISNTQVQPQDKPLQYQSNQGGKNYQIIEQKFLITPSTVGDITIPSAQIKGVTVNGQDNGFFAMARSTPFTISSNPLTLHVKAIPPGIAINDWLPAKQMELIESWSTTSNSLKIGEPITRTITLNTLGVSATVIPDINVLTPNGVNAYPDKTISNTAFSNDDISASKTFKIAYVPTKAGDIIFPEVQIKWWDTTTNSVKKAVLPAKSYTILPDNKSTTIAAAATSVTSGNQPTIVDFAPGKKVNNIWYYLTIGFGILWIVTVLISIILLRKKSKLEVVEKSRELVVDSSINQRTALAKIYKACQDQNPKELNLALIAWASVCFGKKIYTISDISDLIDNDHLRQLIDELNLALYRNQPFVNYTAIVQEINSLNIDFVKPNKNVLQKFYPD